MASESLLKLRSTPGKPLEVTVNSTLSPKKDSRTVTAALLTPEWAEGYSWKYGVTSSGSHPASGFVSGLPSSAACAIAVTGRQKLNVVLASQTANEASASARFTNASNRAVFRRLR